MGIHIEGYGNWNSTGSSGQWVPSGPEEEPNDFRYIYINGSTSLSHGLVMSGNTPLSVRTPKTSSVSIPYSHGSVDLSKADGRLYFNERNLRYTFAAFIDRWANRGSSAEYILTLNEINRKVQNLYSELEDWLYSAATTTGTSLNDCGVAYTGVACTGIEISKSLFPEMWVLTVVITFVANPSNNLSSSVLFAGRDILDAATRAQMRYIEYNDINTLDMNMIMSGNTPLTNLVKKRDTIETNYADGVIDSSSSTGVFYEDRTIAYNFSYFLDCESTNILTNRKAQLVTEAVMKWLYDGWGGTLYDSALNISLPKARATSFSVNKQITNKGYWILGFNIEFTVYPVVSNGGE